MTSQKSKSENTGSNTMVLVDAGKLSEGLKTTFNGVAMIFDSLGIESGKVAEDIISKFPATNIPEQNPSKSREEKATNDSKEVATLSNPDVELGNAADNDADNDTNAANAAADSSDKHTEYTEHTEENADMIPEAGEKDRTESAEPAEVKESMKPEKKQVSSVSLDDITKIIVQKIKKDRSNNQKIGQILKTYGTEKVSELPEEKYEAFLTDLSQL